MGVNFINEEAFDQKKFRMKKKSKVGIIIVSLIAVSSISVGVFNYLKKNTPSYIAETDINDAPAINADVAISDINDMNIIMNNNNCGDVFFSEVCEKMKDDGIVFTPTANDVNINLDNSTVITLDQQYSSGSYTLLFAPYNNTRIGNSDSLAISMLNAFDQNGFLVDGLLCGQVGFEEDENGKVNYQIPTSTEKAIDDDTDSSFVTISFGTQNVNAEWVAKSIENGLVRQKYYLNNYDNDTDLVYRASSNDSIDEVAKYFGTDSYTLKKYNDISTNSFSEAQAVINPDVSNIDAFNKNSIFEIEDTLTRAY